jgi:hypothetical protein
VLVVEQELDYFDSDEGFAGAWGSNKLNKILSLAVKYIILNVLMKVK